MLLALDIGNTNITFGLFAGRRLVKTWRCETKKDRRSAGPQVDRFTDIKGPIDGIVVASVVPEIDAVVKYTLKKKFKVAPLFVTHRNAGVKIAYKRPWEIGADRLVDAVAVWEKYRKACIVVDLGTATTVEYIDARGTYHGGPIAPGIHTANRALSDAASRLPRISIVPTNRIIPRSTVEAMQAGIFLGYSGLIERLIQDMRRKAGRKAVVVLTGGLMSLISKGVRTPHKKEPLLTLEGLAIIWEKNLS